MTERKTVVARAEDGLDADRHGNVKSVAYGNAIETRRRDADNLKRITVQGQPFSNHRGVAGKISLPEGVTDVCSRYAAARLVIPRTKQPPQNRLHAKDVKEIAADADSFRFADLAARGQIESLVGPDGQFGESFLALADLLPHGKGELGVSARKLAGTPVAVCNPDGPQVLGVLDRNGTKTDGVDELEDGSVGADTEGESQDGDDGKAGTEAKKPESMAKVAPERGHSISLPVSDDGRCRMSRERRGGWSLTRLPANSAARLRRRALHRWARGARVREGVARDHFVAGCGHVDEGGDDHGHLLHFP